MDTLARDLGLVAVLLVALVLWRVYRMVSGRDRRTVAQAQAQTASREATRDAPLPGLSDAVRAGGWSGPTADPPADPMVRDYVHEMAGHLWSGTETSGSDGPEVPDTWWTNACTGTVDGHAWYAANAYTDVRSFARPSGGGPLPTSVCTVDIGATLPPLWVGPRSVRPYVHLLLKEVTLESEDFDRAFRVQALDRKYASDVMSPRAMELVMQHDDWTFFLALTTMVCLSREPFASADDIRNRVAAVQQLVSFIPSFVAQDRGLQLPRLPDGTAIDITHPPSREAMEQMFGSMTPDEREKAMFTMQEQGVRFLAGMFGKDVLPGAVEELQRTIDERRPERGKG